MAELKDLREHELDGALRDALGNAAPSWRAFTADAMDAVRSRAARRRAVERMVSTTCGVLALLLVATTFAALRSGGDDGARTLRTADDPSEPSPLEDDDVVAVDPSATTTTRPSFAIDGRDPGGHVSGEVRASNPVVTFPPLATPTTGPTPSTTAPPLDDARPPVAFAALNGVEVQALQGPSCWQRGGRTVCEDAPSDWVGRAPLLDGIQSGSLWFRWNIHEQPAGVVTKVYFPRPDSPGPDTATCEGGNPCRIDFGAISFGTDPKWIVIETRWKGGSVSHAIKVRSHPVEP